MNNLTNRDYHEVIGRIVKIEMNDDLRLGQELSKRIPYNMVGELEEQLKNKKDINPLSMDEEDLLKLIPRLNFNLPDSQYKLMEKQFMTDGDYWALMSLLEGYEHYQHMGKFALYVYCRELCGKPVSEAEFKQINNDNRTIKKSMKQLKNKALKKSKSRK